MKEQLVVSIRANNAVVVMSREAQLHQIPCQTFTFDSPVNFFRPSFNQFELVFALTFANSLKWIL